MKLRVRLNDDNKSQSLSLHYIYPILVNYFHIIIYVLLYILISQNYVYNWHPEKYPFNPNGSPLGIAALCSPDGRHLALMPHPERAFLKWQVRWSSFMCIYHWSMWLLIWNVKLDFYYHHNPHHHFCHDHRHHQL